jgi:hypothetical protein
MKMVKKDTFYPELNLLIQGKAANGILKKK